jgi:hypothetical protein
MLIIYLEVNNMTKPNIYIVVKDGLVQDVYMHSALGNDTAQAEVTICNLDTENEKELADLQKFVYEDLPQFANHIY